MASESIFWRNSSVVVIGALVLCVAVNVIEPGTVPPQVTLFLFGILVSLGVSYSILKPESSLTRLPTGAESSFRRRQIVVGICISVGLLLTLVIESVRESKAIWLFAPIVVLPFILLVKEQANRMSKRR